MTFQGITKEEEDKVVEKINEAWLMVKAMGL